MGGLKNTAQFLKEHFRNKMGTRCHVKRHVLNTKFKSNFSLLSVIIIKNQPNNCKIDKIFRKSPIIKLTKYSQIGNSDTLNRSVVVLLSFRDCKTKKCKAKCKFNILQANCKVRTCTYWCIYKENNQKHENCDCRMFTRKMGKSL